MNINLFPFTVLWMILALIVVGLIAYRKWVAKDEDDTLHVMESEAGLVAQQTVVAEKLEIIDRWGKTLTAIALVYGLAMGSVFLHQAWTASENKLR
jgi:hypothetical protein